MINFTTGPVGISHAVTHALTAPPLSHRSPEFFALYKATTDTISQKLNVKNTYLLTGSGTLANEVMIAQIALRRQHGLIITNGEFGNRLINQATRHQLQFEILEHPTGATISIDNIRLQLVNGDIQWLLFCHCESSTGIINPLQQILTLCSAYNCTAYVDCISTVGIMALDLSMAAMATASSGKGIGSYAGLAIVCCNQQPLSSATLPIYLDLQHAQAADGIPFTLSSNLIAALHEAAIQNMEEERWHNLNTHAHNLYQTLSRLSLVPFAQPGDKIFTIIPHQKKAQLLGKKLVDRGIQLSYQSDYLIKNNWLQLAMMGNYTVDEIDYAAHCIAETFTIQTSI